MANKKNACFFAKNRKPDAKKQKKHKPQQTNENRNFSVQKWLKKWPIYFNQKTENIRNIRNIAQTWFLVRFFVYSSYISQILNFLYWMVCIFILIGMTLKTENM